MKNESFSFPCYRQLCKYLGETDALVEVTELAAREFILAASESGDVAAYVDSMSVKHNIRVNLSELTDLSHHLARNSIVVVYQAAEDFLRQFRREHQDLYRTKWTGDREDIDPLTLTLQNLSTDRSAEDVVGKDLVSRFQYYRIVRNWIAHSADTDDKKPQARYEEIIPYKEEHESFFAKVAAPNPPQHLNFDDFIYFTRLTKLIAERISLIARPPLNEWKELISIKSFKKFQNDQNRMKKAVCGALRTKFGMDYATAEWIAAELVGPLA